MGGEGIEPRPPVQNRPADDRPANDRLDSWKEIAAYLRKEVRTVQRWEKSSDLPVRRLAHAKMGTVFAYKSDLDAWWRESQTKLDAEENKSDTDPDSSRSSVAVLAPPAERSINDPVVSPPVEPPNDRFRRNLLRTLVITLALAAPLSLFWHRLSERNAPGRPKVVLAVRPFKNMSGNADQDFLADGVIDLVQRREVKIRAGQFHKADAFGRLERSD